jgi:ferrous iron transport protein A
MPAEPALSAAPVQVSHGEDAKLGAAACVCVLTLSPGVVARLCANHRHGLAKGRLADLGFVPGTPLRIIRFAPLRDPIEIEIRDTRVCARREELAELFVVPENGE